MTHSNNALMAESRVFHQTFHLVQWHGSGVPPPPPPHPNRSTQSRNSAIPLFAAQTGARADAIQMQRGRAERFRVKPSVSLWLFIFPRPRPPLPFVVLVFAVQKFCLLRDKVVVVCFQKSTIASSAFTYDSPNFEPVPSKKLLQ